MTVSRASTASPTCARRPACGSRPRSRRSTIRRAAARAPRGGEGFASACCTRTELQLLSQFLWQPRQATGNVHLIVEKCATRRRRERATTMSARASMGSSDAAAERVAAVFEGEHSATSGVWRWRPAARPPGRCRSASRSPAAYEMTAIWRRSAIADRLHQGNRARRERSGCRATSTRRRRRPPDAPDDRAGPVHVPLGPRSGRAVLEQRPRDRDLRLERRQAQRRWLSPIAAGSSAERPHGVGFDDTALATTIWPS